jgi:hypothetical protein
MDLLKEISDFVARLRGIREAPKPGELTRLLAQAVDQSSELIGMADADAESLLRMSPSASNSAFPRTS